MTAFDSGRLFSDVLLIRARRLVCAGGREIALDDQEVVLLAVLYQAAEAARGRSGRRLAHDISDDVLTGPARDQWAAVARQALGELAAKCAGCSFTILPDPAAGEGGYRLGGYLRVYS